MRQHTGWAVTIMCNTVAPLPFQGMATSPSLIVRLSSILKISEINGGVNACCVWQKRDRYWSILLDSRLRTTLPWRTVASWTSVINKNPVMHGGPRISGSRLSEMLLQNTQKCNICLHCCGLLPRYLHFYKALIELMLGSNWQVALWLTVFEIFAVK